MSINKILILLIVVSSFAAQARTDDYAGMKHRLELQQKAPDRHKWDLRRDEPRKPFETFRFLGLESGMTVMDVGAAAGYTTEMLAAAVGPNSAVGH